MNRRSFLLGSAAALGSAGAGLPGIEAVTPTMRFEEFFAQLVMPALYETMQQAEERLLFGDGTGRPMGFFVDHPLIDV